MNADSTIHFDDVSVEFSGRAVLRDLSLDLGERRLAHGGQELLARRLERRGVVAGLCLVWQRRLWVQRNRRRRRRHHLGLLSGRRLGRELALASAFYGRHAVLVARSVGILVVVIVWNGVARWSVSVHRSLRIRIRIRTQDVVKIVTAREDLPDSLSIKP